LTGAAGVLVLPVKGGGRGFPLGGLQIALHCQGRTKIECCMAAAMPLIDRTKK